MTSPARIVVIGLGPAPGTLTEAARDAIQRISHRFLRTARHPSAAALGECTTFDELYEEADDFEQVYGAIVRALCDAAGRHGEVLYGVPGSPAVAEQTVVLLRAEAMEGRLDLEVLPAVSFADLAWDRLGIDPLDDGVRLIDGARFATEAAGGSGPFLVAQCHANRVLSDIKLSVDDPPGGVHVTLLHHLGLPDERVIEVPWAEMDRTLEADHLTSLYVPRLAAPLATEMADLMALMRTLRASCPWDREQTEETLAPYAIEEAYELAEAVDRLARAERAGADVEAGGLVDHYVEELGDVLFQVVFHAALAEERGWFTLADVARGVHDKLVHRHPHVFPRDSFETGAGSAHAVGSAADVVRNWEQIKAAEKADRGLAAGSEAADPFADVAGGLPSLTYASKVLKRAEKLGTSVVPADVVGPDELGAALLAHAAAAHRLGLDADTVLRQAAARLRDEALKAGR